jgi:hypothetical protein
MYRRASKIGILVSQHADQSFHSSVVSLPRQLSHRSEPNIGIATLKPLY